MNKAYPYIILLVFLFLCGTMILQAQEVSMGINFDFRVNSHVIDTSYANNAKSVEELHKLVDRIEGDTVNIEVLNVTLRGTTSPEGSEQLNRSLARRRLASLEKFISNEYDIPESIIVRQEGYIDWDQLKAAIDSTDLALREDVQAILASERKYVPYPNYRNRRIDQRVLQLMELDGGKVWQQLYDQVFPHMRSARVMVTVHRHYVHTYSKLLPRLDSIDVCGILTDTLHPVIHYYSYLDWVPRFYIKTNALMLGIGVSNAAVEFDLANHWSIAVPVYYSAWNYFIPTLKFRTLATQPEVRYWFNSHNRGLYLGAHLGVASYNIAVDGGYRYQDLNGVRPALGGGIGVGYRMPFKNHPRWSVEFMLGAGVYSLHHDLFYNVENGRHAGIKKMTYWGIDNAAINISYSIDLKKRNR